MKAKHHTNFLPDRVFSYFQKEWKVLLAVTISGLIYNIGLLAGPWFEGKMTGCLVDILKGADQFSDMLVLVLGYVTAIAIVQTALCMQFRLSGSFFSFFPPSYKKPAGKSCKARQA